MAAICLSSELKDMILSDGQILELVEKEQLISEGFHKDNLTPNGYDVTIKEVSVLGWRPESHGTAVIPKKTWFAISTEEYFRFPSYLVGEIWIRTTWARNGVVPSFGMIDAGFEGNLTLSAYNTCKEIEVPIGETFAQIVFHRLSRDADKKYSERSGNYQGQRGVKL